MRTQIFYLKIVVARDKDIVLVLKVLVGILSKDDGEGAVGFRQVPNGPWVKRRPSFWGASVF